MKKIKKSTITLFISIIAFALTSAFTLTPNNIENLNQNNSLTCSCCTCTSAGNCMEASFCGMTNCPSPESCDLSGVLCGPECKSGF